ncbi:MAG: arylsulfatase, partial [Planctomycetota bacterium]|nr:arylsulfatase [Planctomycetota bacterium]
MHAPPEDIARYRGKFLSGWDQLRKKRLERMKRLGLVDGNLELPPRNRHAPAWDDVDDKNAWDLKMAVYAAMVDRMDRNIGRLLGRLRSTGQEENTL